MRKIVNLFLAPVIAGLTFYAASNIVSSHAESSKATNYQVLNKDGRLYIFTSSERMAGFEKSGELGKGIIKIGHGPDGETVVFDSDEAVFEYESRRVKQILDNLKNGAYQEIEKDGRIYVFSSPERLESFEKSGEMGKGIIKIGHGPNGETVIFDSDEAVNEYNERYNIN
jgi:YHS domain-containing protein